MDTSKLSTLEKSTILARAMGYEWPADRCPICGWTFADSSENGCVPGNCCQRPQPKPWASEVTDLYKPENMAQAWGVLAWAKAQLIADDAPDDWVGRHMDLWHVVADNMGVPEAQTWWLDKCLELAIEAELVPA